MVQKECAQVYLLKIGGISYLQSIYGVFNCLCVQKNCCLILLLAENCMHHNAKSNGRLRITCEQIDVTSKLQTLKNTRKKSQSESNVYFPHRQLCHFSEISLHLMDVLCLFIRVFLCVCFLTV